MPRFVILFHDLPPGSGRQPHFDVMLEAGGVLRTWALEHWPGPEGTPAAQLADHRLAYLEYEGPLSGSRGTVSRHDAGSYEIVEQEASRLVVRLAGQRFRGQLALEQTSGPSWQAAWRPDA
jgi:hypothetical protein